MRETPKVFDGVFKRLMELSGTAVVQFVNGIFEANHPLDSEIEYLTTEYISADLKQRLLDILISINKRNALPYRSADKR